MTSCKSTRFPPMIQARRGREYSPSKNSIYSPMAVEQDQKQIIISKLKEEIQLLQKNSIQLNALKEHYRNLDQQYNLLQNEKKVNDSAFAKYHESALKEICSMKNEIDSMKVEFREKKLQIQDLSADQNTLHNQLDQKQIEIEKLKNDLRSSIADNQELAGEKQKLAQIHRTVAQERQRRADDCKKMEDQIDRVQQKIEQLTKYYDSLSRQQKALTSEIIKFEELNNKADDEITTTSEDLAILNDKISESEAFVIDLQKGIVETGGLSEKLKSDSLHAKKSIQSEVMKNNDTLKNIQQADSLLTIRINQVKQGHIQVELLNEQNVSLQKINTQLQDDMQACKRHLQNLSLLNNELVKHMQAASEEDEQVRELIDRKDRVERSTLRVRQRDQQRKEFKKVDQSTITSSRYNSKRRYY